MLKITPHFPRVKILTNVRILKTAAGNIAELLYLDLINAAPERERPLRRNDFQNSSEKMFLHRY